MEMKSEADNHNNNQTMEDCKEVFLQIETSLKKDDNPNDALDEAERYLQSYLISEGKDEETFQFVAEKLVPKVVLLILKRGDWPASTVGRLNKFLQLSIRFVLKHLHLDLRLMLLTLSRIFNTTSQQYIFYEYCGKGDDLDESLYNLSDLELDEDSEVTVQKWGTSRLFLANIEAFVKMGGFQRIRARLDPNSQDKPADLTVVKLLLKPIDKMREYLDPHFFEEWALDFQKSVFAYILAMSDEELKNETRLTLNDVMRIVERLLSCTNEPEATEKMDIFRLQLAGKCLRSPFLEKRLQGLTDIREFISIVGRKQENERSVHTMSYEEEFWMEADYLVDWLKKNKIVEYLFGDNMHAELIKRSSEVLKFLAAEDALDTSHLDIIWEASMDKYETIKFLVWAKINQFTAALPVQKIQYIFEKIEKIPFSEYCPQTLLLVHSCTINGINAPSKDEREHWFGLDLMWRLIQDDADLPDESLGDQAVAVLGDFMVWEPCKSQRITYIRRCIDNLKKNSSVPRSLLLMAKIMESFDNNGGKDKVAEVIGMMNSRFHLLDLFFSSLAAYKQLVTGVDKFSIQDLNLHVFSGKHAHLQQMKERLEFLDFILAKSRLLLSKEQIDLLWESLIVKPLTPQERDQGFSWFRRIRAAEEDSFEGTVAADTYNYIFDEKIPSLDFSELSFQGYQMIEYYFRFMNWKNHLLEELNGGMRFKKLTTLDLMGTDTLWRAALQAKDEIVGSIAIEFLNKLHRSIVERDKVLDQRESFIRRCMRDLSNAANLLNRGELPEGERVLVSRRIARCINLLKSYVDSFEWRSTSLSGAKRGIPLTIYIKIIQSNKQFQLSCHSNETICDLREKISTESEIPVENLRIISAGKEWKEDKDKDTLGECKFTDGQQVQVMERMHVVTAADAPPHQNRVTREENSKLLPSNILASEEYFRELFRLLTIGEIGHDVWELIMKLPTNERIKESLATISQETFDTSVWEEILDSRSIFKLFYSLRIVESLMHNAKEEEGEGCQEWCKAFVFKGGVAHLLKILMTTNFLHSKPNQPSIGATGPKCLSTLLKVISFFLLQEETDGALNGMHILRSDVVSSALSNFKPADLVHKLLELTWAIVKMDESEKKEDPSKQEEQHMTQQQVSTIGPTKNDEDPKDAVVKYAIPLLVALTTARFELLRAMFDHPSFAPWLKSILLDTKREQSREFTRAGIYQISKRLTDLGTEVPASYLPRTFLLEKLLSFLPTIPPDSNTCKQYFELINKLIADTCQASQQQSSESLFTKLFEQIVQMIRAHPIIEDRSVGVEDDAKDWLIIGLMNMARTLVANSTKLKFMAREGENSFLAYVFDWLLFSIPTVQNHGQLAPPVCKSRLSRSTAFSLLLELARDSTENFRILTERLLKHYESKEHRKPRGWHYLPGGYEKAKCGFVGIKNLGATCYMNSLVQQFFMVPQFRYGLLQAKIPENELQTEGMENSILWQLQTMLAHLQESERKFYNPRPFCKAYKMNVAVQMDADEFFNMLFDKLENFLKGQPQEKMLNNFFGGTLTNQIISRECDCPISEREEPFFTLSLEVMNKNKIEDSLQLFVKGDMLEGDNKYSCGGCKNMVDALKRCCISRLPNNLIVHLKRFEFDLELLRRIKVNDYCEFPHVLNLEPYTKEGLSRREHVEQGDELPPPAHPLEYYDFVLNGILVHTGTADSGHYYSFIKDRDSDNWYHFNDSLVEPFDTNEIPNQCFGGLETTQEWDATQARRVNRRTTKPHSAYMLFYERKLPETSVVEHPISKDQESSVVPPALFKKIWDENEEFFKDKHVFHPLYFRFILEVIKLYGDSDRLTMSEGEESFDPILISAKLGTEFFLETLVHAKEKEISGDLLKQLEQLYACHEPSCRWLLSLLVEKPNMVKKILLQCPDEDMREKFAHLIMHVISVLAPSERSKYFDFETTEETPMEVELEAGNETFVRPTAPSSKSGKPESKEGCSFEIGPLPGKPKSVVIKFMESHLSLLPQSRRYWKHFTQFFLIFSSFADLGAPERKYLLSRRLISALIDVYLGQRSPFYQGDLDESKKKKAEEKQICSGMKYLIEAISILTRGCERPNARAGTSSPPQQIEGSLLKMPQEDLDLLRKQIFYYRAIDDGVNSAALSNMVCYLCWEDSSFSDLISGVITKGVNRVDYDCFEPYFDIFTPLLKMSDSLHKDRVQTGIRQYIDVINRNLKYKNATYYAISYLVKITPEMTHVRNYLFKNRDTWVQRWIFFELAERVRIAVEKLVLALIPPAPTYDTDTTLEMADVYMENRKQRRAQLESLAGDTKVRCVKRMRKIYKMLLNIMRQAKAASRVETTNARASIDDAYPSEIFRLVSYFRLLAWSSMGDEGGKLITSHIDSFYSLYEPINRDQRECDQNKLYLTRFLDTITETNESLCKLIGTNDDMRPYLFDYFISLRRSHDYIMFNEAGLASFYLSMARFCKHEPFLVAYTQNPNFLWAMQFLLLESPDYSETAKSLLIILRLALQVEGFKEKFIEETLAPSYNALPRNAKTIAKVTYEVVTTKEQKMALCLSHGLEALSSHITTSFPQRMENSEMWLEFVIAVELLNYLISWINEDKEKKESLLAKWPQRIKVLSTVVPLLYHQLVFANEREPLQHLRKLVLTLSQADTHIRENMIDYMERRNRVWSSKLEQTDEMEAFRRMGKIFNLTHCQYMHKMVDMLMENPENSAGVEKAMTIVILSMRESTCPENDEKAASFNLTRLMHWWKKEETHNLVKGHEKLPAILLHLFTQCGKMVREEVVHSFLQDVVKEAGEKALNCSLLVPQIAAQISNIKSDPVFVQKLWEGDPGNEKNKIAYDRMIEMLSVLSILLEDDTFKKSIMEQSKEDVVALLSLSQESFNHPNFASSLEKLKQLGQKILQQLEEK